MRLCSLMVVSVIGLVGCASTTVSLDRYDGVYATHFDGIPDHSRICARITNRGEESVDWVHLRLRTQNEFEGTRDRRTSSWTYAQTLEPGQSVAVELAHPPVAAEAKLTLLGSGRGKHAPPGRAVRTRAECTRDALVASTESDMAERSAHGIEVVPVRRIGAAPGETLAAD